MSRFWTAEARVYITSAVPGFVFEDGFRGTNIDWKTSSGADRGTEEVTEIGRWLEKKDATKMSRSIVRKDYSGAICEDVYPLDLDAAYSARLEDLWPIHLCHLQHTHSYLVVSCVLKTVTQRLISSR